MAVPFPFPQWTLFPGPVSLTRLFLRNSQPWIKSKPHLNPQTFSAPPPPLGLRAAGGGGDDSHTNPPALSSTSLGLSHPRSNLLRRVCV